MASRSLYVLGVVLLLNGAHEVLGHTIVIPQGDYMEPCMLDRLHYEVEFNQLQHTGSRTVYRRRVISEGALDCLADNVYSSTEGDSADHEWECLPHADDGGYRTFYIGKGKCNYIVSSIPTELQTCGERSENDIVIYTTSDRAASYSFPGDQVMDSCEVEQGSAESSIVVTAEASGSCVTGQYLVSYDNPAGETIVTSKEEAVLDPPLASCQMVNFTISPVIGDAPVGTDSCQASIITNAVYEADTSPSGWVLKGPDCEYLEFTIVVTGFSVPDKNVGPTPLTGLPLSFKYEDFLSSTSYYIKIIFSSDFNIKVPGPLSIYST